MLSTHSLSMLTWSITISQRHKPIVLFLSIHIVEFYRHTQHGKWHCHKHFWTTLEIIFEVHTGAALLGSLVLTLCPKGVLLTHFKLLCHKSELTCNVNWLNWIIWSFSHGDETCNSPYYIIPALSRLICSKIILFCTALSTLQLFPPSTQLFSPLYPIIPVIFKIIIINYSILTS